MKILVAMSGGVDSSVAALLLQRAGNEVAGLTLRLWSDDCIEDSKRVCGHLGIEHIVLDARETFKQEVILPFVQTYMRGETPNPCLGCNERIKFGLLLEHALSLGFDFIATGHYAGVFEENGAFFLLRGSSRKDQSYALYRLGQAQLSRLILPLGELSKEQIRHMAQEAALPVYQKPDSQDICFIQNHDYASFVAEQSGIVPPHGDIVDEDGNVLGRHNGLIHYTVGQRKGLGGHGKAVYVTGLDYEKNRVIIGNSLYKSVLSAGDCRFISGHPPECNAEIQAKIRYGAPPAAATLRLTGNGRAEVSFLEPQRAVTPGQAVVFYQEERVLGGGIIEIAQGGI